MQKNFKKISEEKLLSFKKRLKDVKKVVKNLKDK